LFFTVYVPLSVSTPFIWYQSWRNETLQRNPRFWRNEGVETDRGTQEVKNKQKIELLNLNEIVTLSMLL
jgi:hypothetical protein